MIINLIILKPAQIELEEIARIHLEFVGVSSARKITDRIYKALDRLKEHPNLGIACRDIELRKKGYRMLICGNYLCFYKRIESTIFVYHIADGRTDYPKLIADLNNWRALSPP